jgi:hypothetical protein
MVDDDSFLEWETRHESFPLHKHIVAGKLVFQNKQHFYYLYINDPDRFEYRFLRWYYGACRDVPSRHCEGKLKSAC